VWCSSRERYRLHHPNDRTTPAFGRSCSWQMIVAIRRTCRPVNGGVEGVVRCRDKAREQLGVHVAGELAGSMRRVAALLLPERGRWAGRKHQGGEAFVVRMAFRQFCVAEIQVPCQIVRSVRRSSLGCCVDTVAGRVLRLVEAACTVAVVLSGELREAGVGCPGPCWPPDDESGCGDGRPRMGRWKRGDRGPARRDSA